MHQPDSDKKTHKTGRALCEKRGLPCARIEDADDGISATPPTPLRDTWFVVVLCVLLIAALAMCERLPARSNSKDTNAASLPARGVHVLPAPGTVGCSLDSSQCDGALCAGAGDGPAPAPAAVTH